MKANDLENAFSHLERARILGQAISVNAMIAADLHDVVEDTDWTIEKLRRKDFSEDVLSAVECLTHREGETYEKFIERVKTNPIAQRCAITDGFVGIHV